MTQVTPYVPLSLFLFGCFISLPPPIRAYPILTNAPATTTTLTPSDPLHKRDFSGGGSTGVGIIVAVVLGVLGFLLLRWHRKRTQHQISKRDLTVRTRLNAWRSDTMPQQGPKRPPEYLEAVGWKSSQPTNMAMEATGGGGGAELTGSSANELPGYSEAGASGRSDMEGVGLQMPGEVHVR